MIKTFPCSKNENTKWFWRYVLDMAALLPFDEYHKRNIGTTKNTCKIHHRKKYPLMNIWRRPWNNIKTTPWARSIKFCIISRKYYMIKKLEEASKFKMSSHRNEQMNFALTPRYEYISVKLRRGLTYLIAYKYFEKPGLVCEPKY